MAGYNKKTLAAQSAQARETGGRLMGDQVIRDTQGEQVRSGIASGLGSAQQQSGAFSGSQAKDLSKYSQGLMVGSPKSGTQGDTLGRLSRARAGDADLENWSKNAKGEIVHKGARDAKKDAKDRTSITLEELAASDKGAATGAGREIRRNEVFGQVEEVNTLFQQAYDAAKKGDYEAADQLRAQGEGLVESYKLNDAFERGEGADSFTFSMGDKWDPLKDVQGEANAALGSPTGMLVGGVVNQARQMMDPNSAESMRFKDSLTSGALAAVDNSRTQAVRALGAEERGAARSMRDSAMQFGAASSSVKMAAVSARSSERFATIRAGVEGDVAAQKAQIHSDAAKMYESFRTDLATNAVSLASAWTNDQSGVRDNFRAIHNNLISNYSNNLFGFAGQAMNNATELKLAGDARKDAQGSTVGNVLGGAASGAAAGSAAGPWGALAGGVIGGVLGALK